MNNLLGQGKEEAKKALKKKILMWLAGLIAPAIPFILGFLAILIFIIIILSPIVMAKDTSSSASDDAGFFEKFGNFLSGNGWSSDERAFWGIIQDSNLDCKRSTLVTATIMYYYQVNPDIGMDYGEIPPEPTLDGEDDEITEEEEMYSGIPYGQLLPDLKRLVKQAKKGTTKYENFVKTKFLKEEPYNNLLEGYADEQARIDEIYQNMVDISTTVECITSTYGNATCKFDVNGGTATNLKVRLLKCGNIDNDYSPIENEELIDFEKYILGVVYQEVGEGSSPERIKTQAIAARSYALTRGIVMGGQIGKIENVNGEWILSMRACTADQVYCDPDNGCWSDVDGGQTGQGRALSMDATVYTGYDESKYWKKAPLSEDAPMRQLVSETAGKVLVDSDKKVINTSYNSTTQNEWETLAQAGLDHFQILLDTYGDMAVDIAENCTLVNGSSTGDFTNWKQYDPMWKDILIGSKTIGDVGCTITSVAIQIAKSGTLVLLDEFNPGTFVDSIRPNAFTNNNFNWSGFQHVTPNFRCDYSQIRLTGNKQNKANQIAEQLEMGRYPIVQVKSGGHWVAIDYVDGENVYMIDPGFGPPTGSINMWDYHFPWTVINMAMCSKSD